LKLERLSSACTAENRHCLSSRMRIEPTDSDVPSLSMGWARLRPLYR
jgi:hypothetical protein